MALTDLLPDRIQWHEGMLLAPQHFQQESARIDALLAWHGLAANPQGWGVRALVIDEALLGMGTLRVLRLEAILPDGMALTYDATQPEAGALELDLQPLAAELSQGELPVQLVLGRSRSLRQAGATARFRGVSAEPVDDEVSEALPADLPRMRANLSLTVGGALPAGTTGLRLMTLHKQNEVFRRGDYQPALLVVSHDNPIHVRAAELAAQIRAKAIFLARRSASGSSRLEDRVALLEQRERLTGLSLMLPALEAVLRSPTVPPHALYLALCMQIGSLSMLCPGSVPLLPPAWTHADPLAAFGPVLEYLEEAAARVSQEWRTELFRYEEGAFLRDLPLEGTGKRIVVGLRGRSERELTAWMMSAVIGSQTVWTSLSDRRVLGAAREPIREAAELGLRAGGDHVLFGIEVSADFVIPGQALVISNLNETDVSQRPQELVLFTRG